MLGHNTNNAAAAQVGKSLPELAKVFGFNMEYKTAEDVFQEITVTLQLFNGMNYSLLKKHQGRNSWQSRFTRSCACELRFA